MGVTSIVDELGRRRERSRQRQICSYEDDKGRTKYVVEFVIDPFGDVEVSAPRDDADDQPAPRRSRGKGAAGDDAETA